MCSLTPSQRGCFFASPSHTYIALAHMHSPYAHTHTCAHTVFPSGPLAHTRTHAHACVRTPSCSVGLRLRLGVSLLCCACCPSWRVHFFRWRRANPRRTQVQTLARYWHHIAVVMLPLQHGALARRSKPGDSGHNRANQDLRVQRGGKLRSDLVRSKSPP